MSRIWSSWRNTSVLGAFRNGKQDTCNDGSASILQQLVNPITTQPLDVAIKETQKAQVKEALVAAKKAQLEWSSISGEERRDSMLALSNAVMEHKDPLARLETLQTGKPLGDSVLEMTEVAKCLRFFAGYADKPMGLSHIDQGMHMTTSREPIGVCGLITSYNYPLMLTGWKLGPSLAAGNSVLIKPAPQTPLTSLALAELASNIIPVDNLLQVLPGSVDTGRAIVELVDKTSFTGSTPGGQAIMRQAADLLQPLTLECGGKNTVIVDADADLEKAVAAIGQGAFSNTGQNCCAVSRVLAHVDIHDKLVALLQEETKQWQPYTETSPPTADASSRFYGPLIDKQQVDRVLTYIIPSRIAFQASLPASLAHYIPPTVYLNVPDEARLSQEEIFGPVLSVLRPFASLEEAIARANDTRFGLAGGVFSGNYANAHRITSQLKAGIVWVNTYNWIPPAAPFGGTKLSGIGKDLGRDALNEFTFTKTTLHSIE